MAKTEKITDYVFTCNLLENDEVIKSYKHLHNEGLWPEVQKTFEATGASGIKIYIQHTRLVLIISLPESVSFDDFQKKYDTTEPVKIKEWDKIMASFQIPPPGAPEGQKWVPMELMYNYKK